MKVNILGTEYTVSVKKYSEDEYFEKNDIGGYCDSFLKEIVLCDMATYPGWENEPEESVEAQKRETMRHEIVHAFLSESGLSCSSSPADAWARNEEMVDWIAIQGPKICKAWMEAKVLW